MKLLNFLTQFAIGDTWNGINTYQDGPIQLIKKECKFSATFLKNTFDVILEEVK